MQIKIYHYNKCKKSRAGLEFLNKKGAEPLVVNYVEEGIPVEKLKELLKKLKLPAADMVRKQEDYYKDTLKYQDINEEGWIKILSEYPKLLRRPIVEIGDKAVVADPPEAVNKILTA